MIFSRCLIGFVYVFSILNVGVAGDDIVTAGDLSFIEKEVDGVKLETVNEYIPNLTVDEEKASPSQLQSPELSENFERRDDAEDVRTVADQVVEEVEVVEDAQVVQEIPVIEEVPAGEEAQVVEEVPTVEEVRVIEEVSVDISGDALQDSSSSDDAELPEANDGGLTLDTEGTEDEETDSEITSMESLEPTSTYDELLLQNQQIVTENEEIQVDLEDARNRLIGYLESDLVKVTRDTLDEKQLQGLLTQSEELKTANMQLKEEIQVLQNTVADLTSKSLVEAEKIQTLNQELQASMQSSAESMRTCDAELNLVKESAENAIMEIGLLQKKTETLEIEANTCSRKQGSGNLTDIYAFLVERFSYDRLVLAKSKVITYVTAAWGGVMTHANTLKQSIVQGVESVTGQDLSQSTGMFMTHFNQATVIMAPIAILLVGHVETLGSTIASTTTVALANAQEFYNETLFPLFHNTVVPQARQLTAQGTEALSTGCIAAYDVYVTSIATPALALYDANLKTHVDSATAQIGTLYTQHFEEFVNTYIAPTSTAVWNTISPTVNKIRTYLGEINFTESGSMILSELMSYRETAISSLRSNEMFEKLFGDHSENVARTIVTLLALYTAYGAIQLLFGALLYVLLPKGRKYGRTHGKERASIRYVRKGSQDLTPPTPADKEIDVEKEAVKATPVTPMKRPDLKVAAVSPSKRSAPPSPNIFREKIPPYSGTPLKN
jgi:hypothetical protein